MHHHVEHRFTYTGGLVRTATTDVDTNGNTFVVDFGPDGASALAAVRVNHVRNRSALNAAHRSCHEPQRAARLVTRIPRGIEFRGLERLGRKSLKAIVSQFLAKLVIGKNYRTEIKVIVLIVDPLVYASQVL